MTARTGFRRTRLASVAVAASLLAGAFGAAPAAAQAPGVRVGLLECGVEGGIGFILGSTRDVECVFTSSDGHVVERYVGSINRFGADIGFTNQGVILWAVFAPTSDVDSFALAGDYVGASGEASVVVGAGVNVLVGNFNQSLTLQPVSVKGVTGVNVAAGITGMTLEGPVDTGGTS